MAYEGDSKWPLLVRTVVGMIDRYINGEISVAEYRDWMREPKNWPADSMQVADPVFAILSQLRHDANEFVPTGSLRDSDDMSIETLKARIGFAREALGVVLGYWEHVNRSTGSQNASK